MSSDLATAIAIGILVGIVFFLNSDERTGIGGTRKSVGGALVEALVAAGICASTILLTDRLASRFGITFSGARRLLGSGIALCIAVVVLLPIYLLYQRRKKRRRAARRLERAGWVSKS